MSINLSKSSFMFVILPWSCNSSLAFKNINDLFGLLLFILVYFRNIWFSNVVEEVFYFILLGNVFTVEPFVFLDFFILRSFLRIIIKATCDEPSIGVIKNFSSILHGLYMGFPKWVIVSSHNLVISGVVFICRVLKREEAGNHCEQYWSRSENVSFFRDVFFAFVDFRSHVLLGASISLGYFSIRCKSEVANFDIKVFIKEKILHFQISVINIVLLHVNKSINQLLEEISRLRIWKALFCHD